MMNVILDITLEDLFSLHVQPEKIKPDATTAHIASYHRAIQWLGWALQRKPMLADLTRENMLTMYAFARHHRRDASTLRTWRCRLQTIAKFSHAKGWSPEIDLPSVGGRVFTATLNRAHNLPGSVTHFYWTKYRPGELGHADNDATEEHDLAVGAYQAFAGRAAMIRAVTAERTEAFRSWLIESNRNVKTAERYIVILHRIVQAAGADDKIDPADSPPLAEPPENLARMPLSVFLERVYFVERPLKPMSREQLLYTVRGFTEWAGREVTVADLNRDSINQYVVALGDRYAPKTIQGRRANLISIWRCAFDNSYVNTRAERVRKVKVPRTFPEAWTLVEMKKIIDATDEVPGYLENGVKRSAYFKALFLTAYDTGLRRADLLTLTRGQIDDEGRITVVMEKTSLRHECHVRPETLAAIKATFPPEREIVFQWPHVTRVLYIYMDKIMASAGIPLDRRGAFQRIRRTSASQLELVSPGIGGRHLGHMTPGLAEKHYLDPRIVRRNVPMPPALK